jgi:hypothetical protein
MNEKDGAIRDASVLGVPKMLILGLQHMFAMAQPFLYQFLSTATSAKMFCMYRLH